MYTASFSNCRVFYQDHSHHIHTLAVEVDGTIVVNVYKPPNASWSNVLLKIFPHPAIYFGDFNSHNQLGVMNTTMLTEIDSWSGLH
jgi:hypothetical protein